jgi:two-component system sensor histidine kinase KdpD
MLIQLSGSVAVALVGGLWPAVLAALWSSLLVNYFSTPPIGNLIISDAQNFLALFVFLGVSAAVAVVVDLSARRSKEAARARAEATTLSDLTRGAAGADDTVQALLEQARTVFQVRGTALLSLDDDGDGAWRLLASAGEVPAPATGESPDRENIEEIDATTRLVLYGRILPASDRRLLAAFGVHLAAQLERQLLVASRREMMRLAESNTMRTSILRAVSHDLRTPLAGIKLSVGALRQTGVPYTPQEEQELLATIEECSDRLDVLVGNLLDMSRLTSDSVSPRLHPLRWYEVIPGALHGVPTGRVRVELPANMPEIDADQGMLERVVANIVENAVKYAPDSDIVVAGSAGGLSPATLAGRPAGELRVIDHGRGIPAERVLDMFRPFQRLDDATQAAGIGLGLAVAKGFTEAMGGRLAAEPTPGGGLTMVITLPLSTGEPFDAPPSPELEPQSALTGRRHGPPQTPSPSGSNQDAGQDPL